MGLFELAFATTPAGYFSDEVMLYIVHCICFCKTFDRLLADFRLTFGGLLTDFRRTFGGLLGLFELAFATTPAGYFSDEFMLYIVHCICFCKTFG